MDHEILSVRKLQAGYGRKTVISNIAFDLRPGEILGLLGANGSGKSTLLKAISGQILPFAGEVRIAGADVQQAPEAAKAQLGYAIDSMELPANLSGRQYLQLIASIRKCSAMNWSCGNLVGRLDFGAWLDVLIREYSFGTRAKLSIAAALLGAPLLLVFDESLNGLDPLVAWEVKKIIAELAAAGHAVIVSTHVVETVPALCNRAMFLAEGQMVQSWETQALRDASSAPGSFEAGVIRALQASMRHIDKASAAAP